MVKYWNIHWKLVWRVFKIYRIRILKLFKNILLESDKCLYKIIVFGTEHVHFFNEIASRYYWICKSTWLFLKLYSPVFLFVTNSNRISGEFSFYILNFYAVYNNVFLFSRLGNHSKQITVSNDNIVHKTQNFIYFIKKKKKQSLTSWTVTILTTI